MIRFSKFFLDERDLFLFGLGIFLIVAFILKIPVSPFRFDSLLVVFCFVMLTRSLVNGLKFFSYMMIAVVGLALSVFLSSYGLLIYFIVALLLYKKTNLI